MQLFRMNVFKESFMQRNNKFGVSGIFLFVSITLIGLTGCNSDEPTFLNYVTPEPIPIQEVDNRVYPLSLLQLDKGIDVLLVIDNSGSMGPIQDNVIKNAKLFFEQFAKQAYVNWKIGIISTDENQDPFLGFATSFDSSMVKPNDPASFNRVVQQFQDAVGRLGTSGSASEYTFYNIKRAVDRYNGSFGESFLRANAHFVTIMISDEEEQSDRFGANQYDPLAFFNTMGQYISSNKILRFYGAIKHKELPGCTSGGGFEPWIGSAFERIIKVSDGFVISACKDNFGNDLARIGEDIVSLVGLPILLLRRRPRVETIKVFYEDKLLPPGREEDGGLWFYEEETNTINFYGMDFVQDLENDRFYIEFDIDDGINRDDWPQ
jgi:hypothetical protein